MFYLHELRLFFLNCFQIEMISYGGRKVVSSLQIHTNCDNTQAVCTNRAFMLNSADLDEVEGDITAKFESKCTGNAGNNECLIFNTI